MAELASASVERSRDEGSNIGIDKTFSDSVWVGLGFRFVWD
jgi:hypothetical protein